MGKIMVLFNISRVEILFYGGLALTAFALVLGMIFAIIHLSRKSRLERTLSEEYGDPARYNIQSRGEKV